MSAKRFIQRSYYVAVIIILLLIPFSFALAQSNLFVDIDSIDNNQFPDMSVVISVLDSLGVPVNDLTTNNIFASEDGRQIAGLTVTPTSEKPLEIILAIDTTDSTGYGEEPTPLQNTVESAKKFVAALPPVDQVGLITFSDQVSLMQDLTADRDLINNALDSLAAGGDSLINDGLFLATQTLKGRTERPVIFLVAEGVDSGFSQHTIDEVIDEAARNSTGVYAVAWGGANQNELTNLTELTGGQLQFLGLTPPDSASMEAAFTATRQEMDERRGQYLLSFISSLPADGNEYELVVRVEHQGQAAESSRHFQTLPGQVDVSLPGLSEGQVVGGYVTFAPDIDSPAPVAQMDLQLDGQPLETVYSEPFEYVWDSTTVSNGTHEITIIVEDTAGNSGQTAINLEVQDPVVVEITSPIGGKQETRPVTISADVTALSPISGVEFLVDGNLFETLTDPPFETTWSPASTDGVHEIIVKATDIDGFSAEDNVRVSFESVGGPGGMGIILAVAAAAIVIAIVLGVRARRRRTMQPVATGATPVVVSAPPAAGVAQASLVEMRGLNPDQTWRLSRDHETTLGRKREDNDIPLKGQTASRRHALIRFQQGEYMLFNLRPENPILVNESPVTQQQILRSGDIIQAGESLFRFEMSA